MEFNIETMKGVDAQIVYYMELYNNTICPTFVSDQNLVRDVDNRVQYQRVDLVLELGVVVVWNKETSISDTKPKTVLSSVKVFNTDFCKTNSLAELSNLL